MKRTIAALAAIGVFTIGCESPTQAGPDAAFRVPQPNAAASARVLHKVSAGGSDLCEAVGQPTGCDANYSLTALEHEDGSVTGQWQDVLKGYQNALHVQVDCLKIVGNVAVVGGVITHGIPDGAYAAGNRAWTVVADNGTSAQDAPDQISYSFPAHGGTCADANPAFFPLLDLAHGQVSIR